MDRLFSDHNIIFFDISLPHTITTSKVKVYRKFNNINPDSFMKDIGELCLIKSTGSFLDRKKSTTIIQCFRQHWIFMLLLKVRNVLTAPGFPGSTMKLPKPSDSAGTLKGSGIGTNLIGWLLLFSMVTMPTHIKPPGQSSMQKFFLTSITENPSDYKCIYEICNHLLGRSKDSPLSPWYL